MQNKYNAHAIERDAQQYWETQRSFRAVETPGKRKYYCLSMFPYPSGKLHMGHVRNYTIGDALSRYHRMRGYNVLQPMGWDAFGLPAENAAMANSVPPAQWTFDNIAYMKKQLRSLGFAIDWERELATCKPDYYRWNQWLFLRMLEKGLVYKKTGVVNWDPVDQTVLANEQVIDGRGWRTGALVEKREIPMYYMAITRYADELLAALDTLPGWPERVKTMQANWIGKSTGVRFAFKHGLKDDSNQIIQNGSLFVFTTRADTIMGVTFVAVAPEHPLAIQAAKYKPEVARFIEKAKEGSTTEAELALKAKEGVDTGWWVIHPLTNEKIPIWVSNYVLMTYGDGAVMGVPAHDERDWDFAARHKIPIKLVVGSERLHADWQALLEALRADGQQPDETAIQRVGLWRYTEDVLMHLPSKSADLDGAIGKFHTQLLHESPCIDHGYLIASGKYNYLSFESAVDRISADLAIESFGEKQVMWRLRDWGISRQRYWGTPIPLIHCTGCGDVPVPDDQLPVVLPEDCVPDGSGNPLAKRADFVNCQCPKCGKPAKRETDTMDTFVDSSWYYIRFACADEKNAMVDERVNYWLPVDQYIGGIEHAILHLLYSRFWTKVMRDLDLIKLDEPFKNLLTQGMVLNEIYFRKPDSGRVSYYNPAEVDIQTDENGKRVGATLKADGLAVEAGGIGTMSKSKNNGVDPQSLIEEYGADTARLFIMFAAPPEQTLEWSDSGVEGASRFLKRLWSYGVNFRNGGGPAVAPDLQKATRFEIHAVLKQADFDMARHQFNTVVSAAMKILNALERMHGVDNAVAKEGLSILLRLLYPITPHISHQMWRDLGLGVEILDEDWPKIDETALIQDEIELVLQVNGKLRGNLRVAKDADRALIEKLAMQNPNVQKHVNGQPVKKVVVVPGRLVNVVV